MKRFFCLLLTIIMTLTFSFSTSANTNSENIVYIDNYTVIFDENTGFTSDEQFTLAQRIINNNFEDETNSQSYGLMCNLFGHKTTTESISVIEHCVQTAQPRCIENYAYLTACSRCDYTDIEIIGSVYIYCCD